MTEEWYVADGERSRGPYARDEMQMMAQNGTLSPGDSICRAGMANWSRAGEETWLFGSGPTVAPAGPRKSGPMKIILGLGLALVLLVAIGGAAAYFILIRDPLEKHEAYLMAMSMIQEDTRSVTLLGEPINKRGKISISDPLENEGFETFYLTFSVRGPLDSARVVTAARLDENGWSILPGGIDLYTIQGGTMYTIGLGTESWKPSSLSSSSTDPGRLNIF